MAQLQIPAVVPQEALSQLERSNEPISKDAFAKARIVLEILQRLKAPAPFVFPTEIGGVQFEWHGGLRELDVEVLPKEAKLAYVTFEDGRCVRESDANATEEDLRALLNWID
jgi:hypothetical protein